MIDRKTDLIVHSRHPYNAEPPLDRLRASYLTPQAAFYVRSHGAVPRIDAGAYRLRIEGPMGEGLELSLGDLRHRFEIRTVMAVMQCAGNRRADLQRVRPVSGDPWAPGAIGNAEWTGVRLSEVLRAAGCDEGPGLHVAFTSHDEIEAGDGRVRFGVSIPLLKALSPEVLLAWAMNGEPLAPEHGFPLRAVVPGFAGVRSPKWLASITVQAEPSDTSIQQTDYKLFPSDVSGENVDWSAGTTINEMPLNAAICEPAPFADLPTGRTTIRGYAIATARAIACAEVSIDGGRNWRRAELEHRTDAPWSWTLWSLRVDLPEGEHELVVRAWDSAGQTQAALPEEVWNFKGYLCAAWHRVRVTAG